MAERDITDLEAWWQHSWDDLRAGRYLFCPCRHGRVCADCQTRQLRSEASALRLDLAVSEAVLGKVTP